MTQGANHPGQPQQQTEQQSGYQPVGVMSPRFSASTFGVHVHHLPSPGKHQLPEQPQIPQTTDQLRLQQSWSFVGDLDQVTVEVALLTDEIACVRLIPHTQQMVQALASGYDIFRSWAVLPSAWQPVRVKMTDQEGNRSTVATKAMQIEIARDPFRLTFHWPDGTPFAEDDPALGMGIVAPLGPGDLPDPLLPAGSARCYKRLAVGEVILGAGERTEPLDKRGHRLTFWNTDPPQPHSETTGAMYASIPFWLGLRDGHCYGIFLDSVCRSDLDVGASRPDLLSFGVASGDLTYYVFAGPTPAAVLAQYSALAGRMPLPPRWALGYAQSRWSYFPAEHLCAIADSFRSRRIPCDSLWLDIDYMDGYRVFTWSPTRYPQPAETIGKLNAQGFKVVTIIDPGVKADPTDTTYAEGLARNAFVRRPDGSLYTGVVWPGQSVFPDFSRDDVRQWWGERHAALLDVGVAGIWDDMNEPSLTDRLVPGAGTPHGTTMAPDAVHHPDGPDGPAIPHANLHNAYGMQMARATFEGQARLRPDRRPFVLTRSGYAGIQRYAALWTGDNLSRWEHLRLAARMCLNLGLSGVPFVGFDTGGFWGNATGELMTRFTQLGSVFPFFRNHSAMETLAQEPWIFGQPYEAFIRAAIEQRYRLLPYLYTLFAEAARTGAPITRAMAYAYPNDATLAALDDQFLLGDALLVAPAFDEGQVQRQVMFPGGDAWRDWLTGHRYTGAVRTLVDARIDMLPLYLREGTILPLGPVMQYVGELAPKDETLTLVCCLGPDDQTQAAGELYEDDGATPAYQQGAWRRTHFTAERAGQRVTMRATQPEGTYALPQREVTVELRLPLTDLSANPPRPQIASATLDGNALDLNNAVKLTPRRYETLLSVALSPVAFPFTLEVALG